jgi:predicted flap endonuclease-1-like 5' DNA nuclease
MSWLFFQIWLWLLAAFALGWFSHWFLCCRGKQSGAADEVDFDSRTDQITSHDAVVVIDEQWKPLGLTQSPNTADDLKQISGVGPVTENTLYELGVYHFSQISEWDDNNVAWIENHLSFPGRIKRENWVGQAKELARGHNASASNHVEDGK